MKRKHKAGRWLSVLLTLAMVLTMLPTAGLAANQEITEALTFTADTPDVTDQPGYSWEQSSKTLTLKGITMTVDSTGHIISVPDGTRVVLEEGTTNSITMEGWSATAVRYGICAVSPSAGAAASMTISGSGTLNINATDVTALYLGGLLAEGGGTITVEGGDINVSINGSSRGNEGSNGQTGDVCGIKAGSLNITGGSVLAGGKWAAVRLDNQPNEENLKVSGSTEVLDDPAQVTGDAAWDSRGNFPNYKVGGEVAKTLLFKEPPPPADYTLYLMENKLCKPNDSGEYVEYTEATDKWEIKEGALILKDGFAFSTTAETVLEILDDTVSTITVEGAASLTSTFSGEATMGAYGINSAADADLTINGGGTLTVVSGSDTTSMQGQSTGLSVSEGVNLTVDGATVNLTAGSASFNSTGLAAGGDLTLQNGAQLTTKSSETAGENDMAFGVMVMGTLTVSGDTSKLTAQGAVGAYVGVNAIDSGYTLTASTDFSGTGATGEGITPDSTYMDVMTIYKKGGANAKYLTVAAGEKPPTPTDIDYTLYFNPTDGTLHKNSANGELVTTEDVPNWSAEGKALTLEDGFDFSTTAGTALKFDDGTDAELWVEGTASITSTYAGTAGNDIFGIFGIYAQKALAIKGGGTLTVQSGNVTGASGETMGIAMFGDKEILTVDGTTVRATAGSGPQSMGIQAWHRLDLANGARVTSSALNPAEGGVGVGAVVSGALVVQNECGLTAKGATYAYSSSQPIAFAYTLSASTSTDGTGANSEGITNENIGSPWAKVYKKDGEFVKYLKVGIGGTDPPPTPPETPTITVSAQPEDATVTYGETATTLTAAGAASDDSAVTYQWYKATSASSTEGATLVSGATGSSFTTPDDLAVGNHYYFCKLSAEGCEAVNTNIATVTVEKADYTGLKVSKVYVKAGEASSHTFTLPELPAGASYGAVTVHNTLAGAIVTDPAPTVENGVLSYSVTDKLEDRYSATIKIAVTGADNYADYNFSLIVTGTAKTPVTISGLSAQEHIVYDGQPQTGFTGTAAFATEGAEISAGETAALAHSIICYYEGIGNDYFDGEDKPVPPH